jgi:SNF2 family DNA or RNA helicase
MLVLAPLTVCLTTWQTEPQKWLQFYGLKIGLAHGPDKALILNDPFYDIVIMNYDGIQWSAPLLAKGHTFTVLLCDELTRLKHTTSKRFKTLKPLLPSFCFRWGLTGTPAANGLMDLFGQCYILDLGQSLGRYITHFRLKYFYQKSWEQYKWYIKESDAEKLIERISDMAMYLDPKDYLTLPPLIDITLPVTLSKETQVKYLALEADFIMKFNSDVVTAANAAVLTSKLRQFTGGAIYDTERVPHNIHEHKIERLKELVEELNGQPLMVAYQFEHEYTRLLAAFPEALAIRGGMSKKQLSEVVETWNQNQTQMLLVQPTAAALGLNLQFGGNAICWFTLTYNLEEYIQLIARLLRRGQTKSVMNYILAAENTIDAVVAKAITTKGITQDSLFSSLKYWSIIKGG